jgi:hypothetical protein
MIYTHAMVIIWANGRTLVARFRTIKRDVIYNVTKLYEVEKKNHLPIPVSKEIFIVNYTA